MDIFHSVAYDPADSRVYVTNAASNTVSVISTSTNKVVDTIHVGKSPSSVAYDSADGEVYVTNSDSNTVSVISTTLSIQPSPNNNNVTTAKGFGGHDGNSIAITGNTNSSHSNHGGADDN